MGKNYEQDTEKKNKITKIHKNMLFLPKFRKIQIKLDVTLYPLIVYKTFNLTIWDVGKEVENRNLHILLEGVKINTIILISSYLQ